MRPGAPTHWKWSGILSLVPWPDQRPHPCAVLRPRPQCCPSCQGIRGHHCPSEVGREGKPRPGLLMHLLSSRYDEDSGGSGDEGRDEAHKREWNLFYQKQMSLRKVKGAGSWWGPRWPPAHTPSARPSC